MKCENCDIDHIKVYGSGRFCSLKCARSFSTKNKRQEINEKVSRQLKGKPSILKGTKLTDEHKQKVSIALKGKSNPKKFTFEQAFCINGTLTTQKLKQRILKENLIPYRCIECNNGGTHNNKPLTLHLDHINGINNDNRIENLRFLCPNCHSQTETYAGKNIIKRKQCVSVV